ncbi:MAG: 3-methyladenine DNA glycosylase [Sulfurovum sp.]|nr:3-methyladenine DNA glycosylase [Sulfurovum sp.]MCB4745242.1 3-methyladenine DNA glycosylase [Sulfurovum sp.]MCB4746187.1 3-methyladenine DNA glycosylase [Sulfurovum sp.]MCB4749015.1 3-methyladenine DNA glycosylase [Sulfurovum sp.]MCB4750430.1 3-methyladenine DNA glycosylase [Sulfurovum sp.]
MINNSFELLCRLKEEDFLQIKKDPFWWPQSGTPKVIIGAILTQQTKWERVEESLENLEELGICSLEGIADVGLSVLRKAIFPSGFYNMKAQRLKQLSKNILETYGNFMTFQKSTDRKWLLSQKGIGMESADSILCYACYRPIMVVDSYTNRLLVALGYTFDHYMDIQAWIHEGIEAHENRIVGLYKREISLPEIYARFHGKIVEFSKEYIRGQKVDISLFDFSTM